MAKLTFSGHESFACKQFWLKKGYDFAKSGQKFSDDTAVIDLGVGKNMVNSIRFWANAFGVIENKSEAGRIGNYLLGDDGKDTYLEDIGSVWLLHYNLVKNNHASIYQIVFNEFQNERSEFTKTHLHNFLKKKCEEVSPKFYNKNTIDRDITVFLKNYLKPEKKRTEIEDNFAGLLHELNLLEKVLREKTTLEEANDKSKGKEWYYFIRKDEKDTLPKEILLYAILDSFAEKSSISFKELFSGENAPAQIFALDRNGLYLKIDALQEKYPEIVF